MMAGAAPGKTQQLLDKSLIQRNSARGLICIKGKFVFTYRLYYGYKNEYFVHQNEIDCDYFAYIS